MTDPRPSWTLYYPGTLEPADPPPLPEWVQEVAFGPRETVGELEYCPLLPGALASSWTCAIIPEYINPHTLVASIRSPQGRHAMLFFAAVGPELHQQPRDGGPDLIGWFHIRLREPVVNRKSLIASLRYGAQALVRAGFIAPSAVQWQESEA